MPANKLFIKPHVQLFAHLINAASQTEAEHKMEEATAGLNERMTPMKETKDQHIKYMAIPAALARLLTMQTRSLARQHPGNPIKALDIGTFTGGSAGALAKGMLFGGEVVTCDISPKNEVQAEHQEIAKAYWKDEGLLGKVKQVLAPASETLQKLLDKKEEGTYDIAFIDADKLGYDDYYEKALKLLRPGGIIILDNMLWSGKVAKARDNDANTRAIRALNFKISEDQRVDYSLIDGEDGIMIVEKRDPELFRKRVKVSKTNTEELSNQRN